MTIIQADGQRALEIYDEIIRHGEYWTKIERNLGIISTHLDNYKMAVHNSALIYLKGKAGVPQDGYKAIEYFEKISDFKKISEIYRYGKAGIEPNPRKAIEYFLKHESTYRFPPSSDDELNESYISLDNERRADAFRNIAEIYFKLNDGRKALEFFLKDKNMCSQTFE